MATSARPRASPPSRRSLCNRCSQADDPAGHQSPETSARPPPGTGPIASQGRKNASGVTRHPGLRRVGAHPVHRHHRIGQIELAEIVQADVGQEERQRDGDVREVGAGAGARAGPGRGLPSSRCARRPGPVSRCVPARRAYIPSMSVTVINSSVSPRSMIVSRRTRPHTSERKSSSIVLWMVLLKSTLSAGFGSARVVLLHLRRCGSAPARRPAAPAGRTDPSELIAQAEPAVPDQPLLAGSGSGRRWCSRTARRRGAPGPAR